MDISIIIPVYNEEASISEIFKKVHALDLKDLGKEILIIDDGSTDETKEILKGFLKHKNVKVITHQSNFGKGRAIRTGIEHSKGDIIAIQDSDLEYDPNQLPELISHIVKGEDVVYGSRFKGSVENMAFHFYIGNKFLSLATRILYHTPISDMETGFKIFKRRVLEGIHLESDGFDIEPELTAKIIRRSYKILEVPIKYRAREKEEKKITFIDGIRALVALVKYRFKKL